MCENSFTNLIDLSIEEEEEKQRQQELFSENLENSPSKKLCIKPDCLLLPLPPQNFDGPENNPFDCVQRLANRAPDPFDIVEKEARVKARKSIMPPADVKIANLISLGDEVDSNDNTVEPTMASVGSTIYHSALEQHLDSESPPISMSIKSTPDSGSTALGSIEDSVASADGNSAKIRKSLEYRKSLLKFSISNSTFNSPLSRHMSRQCDSDFSRIFSAAALYSDHMIATESPVKLVDDDLMAEEPPKFADSLEKDYDADLEMLSIPMLKELSTKVQEKPTVAGEKKSEACSTTTMDTYYTNLPDLSTIREKLRNKRIESSNSKEVVMLLQNLRSLICGNDLVDGQKKEQANNLLEKLTCALSNKNEQEPNNDTVDSGSVVDNLAPPPQPIVRQGTFDLELEEGKKAEIEKATDLVAISSEETLPMTQSIQSPQSLSPAREIPDVMFKSSATYDGEPMAERENLVLPIVDPISPIPSPKASLITTNPDINEIVEQLSKLLEQQQLSQGHSDSSNGSDATGTSVNPAPVINPTFIVVMPTAGVSQQQNTDSCCHDEKSPPSNNDNVMRRRSQSLSIHDKVKILQLPMRAPPAKNCPSSTKSVALPVIEAKIFLDGNGHANENMTECKTPMRNPMRRNSFSSTTPSTPATSYGANSSFSKRLQNTGLTPRYSIGVTKQHDHLLSNQSQKQAIIQPLPRANLDTFKPDLKRKIRPQTNSNSIMKSKAPLKAVIPIKKVAPMLTVSLPTPKVPSGSAQSNKPNMNSSIHLLTNANKISYTSTPMPLPRSTGATFDRAEGFPNACSTPALAYTPMRPSGTITKNPRFLLTSAKQQTPTTTELSKKRALPELVKGKSPVKPRVGLSLPPPPIKGRASLKPQSNVAKTTNRSSTRLGTHSSIAGTTVTNKENKKP